MNKERKYDLQERLFKFALMVIKIVNKLPPTIVGREISRQLFESGTSPGANYEEDLSAESKRDFIHKLKIVLKELRETRFWLKLIRESKIMFGEVLEEAIKEAVELVKIIATSIHTAEQNIPGGNIKEEIIEYHSGVNKPAIAE